MNDKEIKAPAPTYKVLHEYNDAILALLDKTVYGTKGGLMLRHKEDIKKIKTIYKPDFHTLYLDGELCAVAAYLWRPNESNPEKENRHYIRYFSVSPKHQNKGYGRILIDNIEIYYVEKLDKDHMFYTYIEKKNLKSQSVSDHFKPDYCGQFSPLFFSRFFPKKQKNVAQPNAKMFEKIKQNAAKVYENYIHYTQKRMIPKDTFYLEEDGKLKAHCHVEVVNWEVLHYPDKGHFWMYHFLPKIPIVNKLAQGKRVDFLAIDQVYYEQPEDLFKVLEHALNHYGLSKSILYFDHSTDFYKDLNKHKKLGFMTKVQPSPAIQIQTFFYQADEEALKVMNSKPKYIPAFDVT